MNSGSSAARHTGFTYVAVLFFVAVSGAMLAATGIIWSHERQRQKEEELIWIGNQFRQAIALHYQRTPGAIKRYPEKLEDLLEDRRYLSSQRYLRQIYRDPMTGKPQWGMVPAPGGGIMGIYSLSDLQPVKIGGARETENAFSGAMRYNDWLFTYEAPVPPAPRRE